MNSEAEAKMDPLMQKTFTTSRSLTYSYYISPPPPSPPSQNASAPPPLLLLHGFPDGPLLWRPLLPYLLSLPHRLIIPSLLGYHPTSTPRDPTAYNSKSMSDDLAELLTAEDARTAIAIGHDWGSFLANRLCLWHPERVAGLALLNLAYMPPNQTTPFDLDQTNALMEQLFGHPILAYWELLTRATGDVPALLEGNAARLWELLHAARPQPEWMRKLLCERGATEAFLTAGTVDGEVVAGDIKLRDYAGHGGVYWEDFVRRLTDREAGGIAPALCWYRAMSENATFEVERTLEKEALVLKVPTLFVACPGDAVCRAELIEAPKQEGLLPDLTVVEVGGCGHWGIIYEKAEETAGVIGGFLKERFGSK
ncbi:putative epoxide hydrolase [Histoplasma ohiense]|nr:putative epoxide hydrolase [Histoplasma ohiense (nom. inval.)]